MSEKTTKDIQDEIINNAQRLNLDDTLTFECHPGVSCFGRCCRDINIFLTPYDVLRLKKALGISSDEFIAKYALSPEMGQSGSQLPIVVLRMGDDEERRCQFNKDGFCSVYEDRPWACRMYPVGSASSESKENPDGEKFYFLVKDELCKGHEESKTRTIKEYFDEQKVETFEKMNEEFQRIAAHPMWLQEEAIPAPKLQMFFMACYNLDMFKRFVGNSKFFEMFQIVPEIQKQIMENEETLLLFAFDWVKYFMWGERTLQLDPAVLQKRATELRKEEEERNKAGKPPAEQAD